MSQVIIFFMAPAVQNNSVCGYLLAILEDCWGFFFDQVEVVLLKCTIKNECIHGTKKKAFLPQLPHCEAEGDLK